MWGKGLRTSKTKKYMSSTVHTNYLINIQEIKPWPPSQSLKSIRSVVLQWENGLRSSGFTHPSSPLDSKIEFNESFMLQVSFTKDTTGTDITTAVGTGVGTFETNLLEFSLYEPKKENPKGKLIGSGLIDLADYGVLKEAVTLSVPLGGAKKSWKGGSAPVLCVKIQPLDRDRDGSGGRDGRESGTEYEAESEPEITSFTDDEERESSHSSLANSGYHEATKDINGGSDYETDPNGSFLPNIETLKQEINPTSDKEIYEITPRTPNTPNTLKLKGLFKDAIQNSKQKEKQVTPEEPRNQIPILQTSPNPGNQIPILQTNSNPGNQFPNFQMNSNPENQTRPPRFSQTNRKMSFAGMSTGTVTGTGTRRLFGERTYSTLTSSYSTLNSDLKLPPRKLSPTPESPNPNPTSDEVKDVHMQENPNPNPNPEDVEQITIQNPIRITSNANRNVEKIRELEARVELLEGELRDSAAVEIGLYSIVPEHASSAHKVHTPARRLARLYIFAVKNWSKEKKAKASRSISSALVLVARSSGNDVPRSNCYRVSFSRRFKSKMERALNFLKERRAQISNPVPSLTARLEPGFGLATQDPFFCLPQKPGIEFPVLFWVNSLLHKGTFSQHQLTEEFFDLLRSQSEWVNIAALREMWSYKRALFDPTRRLKSVQDWLIKTRSSQLNPKPDHLSVSNSDTMEVRRLIITPTRAYCLPPETELSNRVLRKYKSVADRFLRVTFMDEGMQPLNSNALNFYVAPIVRDLISNAFQQKTAIYPRVHSILTEGFHLCGRRYSFLAFSSNQLRDRSAWFFADTKDITAAKILKWMGRFSNRVVAKCAARMGQCFSSTYATVDVPIDQVDPEYPDVERNGYVFSDGIGKITPDLADEVAKKLQLSDNPPSAYQIRYAGFKGVIAVWPEEEAGTATTGTVTSTGMGNSKKLFLRPSMNKFESNHMTLEVISWTRFQPGFLNRQIVTLLSALGVPDQVFADMQDKMIHDLDKIMTDPTAAFNVVTKSCGEQGTMARSMLIAGFRPQNEPHLRTMLSCIRSGQLGDLLSKARVFVNKGRWLMGCLDESEVLQQGQCFIQVSDPSLQRCFIKQTHDKENGTGSTSKVVSGTVVIAKNPCLHPGDIRVLEAVDAPGLSHLTDCLVFPQNGERPHANEASGSDLDGDLYFVTWDPDLIPPSKRSWIAMDYSPAGAKTVPRQVSRSDIITFFVRNMVNENLGVICNAHVVHADRSEYGALDENCLKLAELAATAVDFPKTGVLVTMPPSLRPKVYPDFMNKDEHLSYKSEKILGKLYRKIKDMSYDDESDPYCTDLNEIPYDTDLEVIGSADYLSQAWRSKCSYDTQLNALLNQYRVESEGELVTGHISSLPKYNSRKQGDIKEKLKMAYSSLKKEFRAIFEEMSMPVDFKVESSNEEKAVFYERKASAWYKVTYHPEWVRRMKDMEDPEKEGNGNPVRLSFAWIAADYLGRIKLSRRDKMSFDLSKPIDALAAQLAERL